MLHNDYPNDEFFSIDWETSGFLANGSGSARAAYYGVGGVPDVYFDGGDHVVGAGDSISAYNQFRPRLINHLSDPNHSKIIIQNAVVDFNSDTLTGELTIDLEIAPAETVGTPQNVTVRTAVIENDISTSPIGEPSTGRTLWNYIGRAMALQTALTASLPGETQNISHSFAIDSSWDPNNLEAIVFLQRDTNRIILQAGKALNKYGLEVAERGKAVAKTSGTPAAYDFQVTYTGNVNDDVTVTLDRSGIRAGWDAEVVWMAISDPNSITIPSMTKDQVETVTVRIIPDGSGGLATVSTTTAPVSNTSLRHESTYSLFSNTPAVLFVDDDNGETNEALFEDAIADGGYHSITQPNGGGIDFMVLFDAIVWNTGSLQSQTIGGNIQSALMDYLNQGGNFFLTSQGYLNHQGLTTFTTNYLGVSAFQQDQQAIHGVGIAGDPIGDGLDFAFSPPFPDFGDWVTPGVGTAWLERMGASPIGVRYDAGTFKTVFLSAAFEGVPTTERNLIMKRVLEWMVGPAGSVGVTPTLSAAPLQLALWQNAPNPFRTSTSVRFAVPQQGPVSLAVFDVAGRRVADLVSGPMGAGEHTASWDGVDGAGRRVASGVYLVRLRAGGETLTKEMLLLK